MSVGVAGAVTGLVYLATNAAVSDLRKECMRLIRTDAPVKLILSGRTLLDDTQLLSSLSISPNSKVLVMRGQSFGENDDEAQRARRLETLGQAVSKIASSSDYELTIENQDGGGLRFSEEDKKALSMALALHAKSRSSAEDSLLVQSLEEVLMAEEAFDLVQSDLSVDNFGLILLDVVWISLQLKDHSMLGSSRDRLSKARRILEKCYGAELERARRIKSSEVPPELATMIRLEVLEGVSAFFHKDLDLAHRILSSAKDKTRQFEVSEESLSALNSMGFGMKESIKALQACNQGSDLDAVVAQITQNRAHEREIKDKRRRMKAWDQEKGLFGELPGSDDSFVSLGALNALSNIGFERKLAGEALRLTSNDLNTALTLLSDPARMRNMVLEVAFIHSCWREHYDTRRGRRYWSNRLNGGSVWSEPKLCTLTPGEEKLTKRIARMISEVFESSNPKSEIEGQGQVHVGGGSGEEAEGEGVAGQAARMEVDQVEGQGDEAIGEGEGEGEDRDEAEADAMEEEVLEGVRRRARAEVDLDNLREESEVIEHYLKLCLAASTAPPAASTSHQM